MDNKAILVLLSSVCFVYGCNSGPCGPGRLCRRSTQEISEDTHELRLVMEGSNYRVKLQEDPCTFKTYDIDHDGTITQEELFVKLGTDRVTEALFNDLEIVKEDGVITPEEFDAIVTSTILECNTSD
ncbi:uncharacterized protein LOC132746730 isoform X2 [Ruditapes philippinarum]|uniref:uncharacterized protein LOC132746730 isoform X2 n=1 Tax=Ruditapes philippinarum TaxID=129788 RepID=UPI00295B9105|nr:uncharacterized protein LOC132746730 isoform X2 [Ruditapes philippinarum]